MSFTGSLQQFLLHLLQRYLYIPSDREMFQFFLHLFINCSICMLFARLSQIYPKCLIPLLVVTVVIPVAKEMFMDGDLVRLLNGTQTSLETKDMWGDLLSWYIGSLSWFMYFL